MPTQPTNLKRTLAAPVTFAPAQPPDRQTKRVRERRLPALAAIRGLRGCPVFRVSVGDSSASVTGESWPTGCGNRGCRTAGPSV